MAGQTPLSMIDKLARCQKILGYTFRDSSILKESLTIGTNKRLATAGDTYVQVALVDRWYSLPHRTSSDCSTIKAEALSNNSLASVGFSRGLDVCALPVPCFTSQQMADTVEAVLAAVYRDALFENGKRKAVNWDEFERVVARLGINHALIASTSDLRWALSPLRTTRKLPLQFFSKGHYFALAKMLDDLCGKLHPPSLSRAGGASDVHPRVPYEGPYHAGENSIPVDGGSSSLPALHERRRELEANQVPKQTSWASPSSWLLSRARDPQGLDRRRRDSQILEKDKVTTGMMGQLGFWAKARSILYGNPEGRASYETRRQAPTTTVWTRRREGKELKIEHLGAVDGAAFATSGQHPQTQQPQHDAELTIANPKPKQHMISGGRRGNTFASAADETTKGMLNVRHGRKRPRKKKKERYTTRKQRNIIREAKIQLEKSTLAQLERSLKSPRR